MPLEEEPHHEAIEIEESDITKLQTDFELVSYTLYYDEFLECRHSCAAKIMDYCGIRLRNIWPFMQTGSGAISCTENTPHGRCHGNTIAVMGSLHGLKTIRRIVDDCIAHDVTPAPLVERMKKKSQAKKERRIKMTSEVTINLQALRV